MATFELKMPKLGESITEATITKWLKQPGDKLELDDPILEIATDKVDSEIPSPVEGILKKQLFKEGETVAVDESIAVIALEGEEAEGEEETDEASPAGKSAPEPHDGVAAGPPAADKDTAKPATGDAPAQEASRRFYSPLVRNMARKENIPPAELEAIPGTGKDGRLTKDDLLAYLKQRTAMPAAPATGAPAAQPAPAPDMPAKPSGTSPEDGTEIVEMDRMRRLIAEHMVRSRDTSVHISLFAEADLSSLVAWREKHKAGFAQREGEKLTFTPIFIQAIARALTDFPMVNVSLDSNNIIKHKGIHIGMAVALPDGNLIVPVIRNANHKSLLGLTKEVNDLARRARENRLKPDEIQGGTFTLTNFGTFGLTTGTPIINQPQTAILGAGLIRKKAAVIESPQGDSIGIRHQMVLSLGCDHRIIDGALGGMFLKKVVGYLEDFDVKQGI